MLIIIHILILIFMFMFIFTISYIYLFTFLIYPCNIQEWCDKQHIARKRVTLDIPRPAWAKFIRSMLSNFETSAHYRVMEFVECVGFQHHTAKAWGGLNKKSANDQNLTGIDLNYFRYCFGPGLFLKSDGSVDPNPIHFWFPWLSDKLSVVEPVLEPLDFLPSSSLSLEDLIRAYTPGQECLQKYIHCSTLELENSLMKFICQSFGNVCMVKLIL